MKFRTTTICLLFLVLIAFSQRLLGQTFYEFMVEVPTMDSAHGNQPFNPSYMWIEAHPSYTGSVSHAGGYFTSLGLWRDSVYAYGPGTGLFLVSTVDCNGDTVHLTVPMDSTLNWGNILADTFFICAPASAICTDTFSVSGPPGGPSYTFNGAFTGVGGLSGAYYTFGDGSSASGLTASHTYTVNGTYAVTLDVYLGSGCFATYTDSVTITNSVCNGSILPSQVGNATYFWVNSSVPAYPASFIWDFGDGQTMSTSTNGIFHGYPSSGTYTPCVITTFTDGCIDTTCSTYNIVLGSSGTCSAWFAYGVNGQTVNFQDSSTTSSPGTSWWWDFGDGSTDSLLGNALAHAYVNPGTYNVSLQIFTQDTCYDVVTRAITVGSGGTCSAGFTHAADTTGQYSILAYNTSVGNNLSYLWDFGDGSTSTQPYPIHTYSGAGTYQICLAVTQASPACTDTFCDMVTITQKQLTAFTFAVSNPATQVTPDQPVASQGLFVFPNPASDRLHIRLPQRRLHGARVQVSNALGQVMLDLPATAGGDMQLDVSHLPDGMYFLRSGTAATRFWIIR